MRQFLIALDQLLNVCVFWLPGGCWADETLSSRAHRIQATHPLPRKVFNAMFFWQPDHCKQSYENERNRSQLPPEMRS